MLESSANFCCAQKVLNIVNIQQNCLNTIVVEDAHDIFRAILSWWCIYVVHFRWINQSIFFSKVKLLIWLSIVKRSFVNAMLQFDQTITFISEKKKRNYNDLTHKWLEKLILLNGKYSPTLVITTRQARNECWSGCFYSWFIKWIGLQNDWLER